MKGVFLMCVVGGAMKFVCLVEYSVREGLRTAGALLAKGTLTRTLDIRATLTETPHIRGHSDGAPVVKRQSDRDT